MAKQEAESLASEVFSDDGKNVNLHYKQVGYVNGLDFFQNIIKDKIIEYQEKAKQQRENPILQDITES